LTIDDENESTSGRHAGPLASVLAQQEEAAYEWISLDVDYLK